jgi:antagonist of KipI
MLSTGVSVGTVQVTHAGLPVILMADGQTTGGYPRIAQIITADIPLCGQCRPGSAIRFTPISEMEAAAMYRLQMYQLSSVTQSIRIRFGL